MFKPRKQHLILRSIIHQPNAHPPSTHNGAHKAHASQHIKQINKAILGLKPAWEWDALIAAQCRVALQLCSGASPQARLGSIPTQAAAAAANPASDALLAARSTMRSQAAHLRHAWGAEVCAVLHATLRQQDVAKVHLPGHVVRVQDWKTVPTAAAMAAAAQPSQADAAATRPLKAMQEHVTVLLQTFAANMFCRKPAENFGVF